MSQVQKTIGRLVQRFAGKVGREAAAQPQKQVAELDAQSLKQVSGGTGTSQSPTKGW